MRRLFLNSVLMAAFLVATSAAQTVQPNPPGFGGVSGPGLAKGRAVRTSKVPSTRIYVKTVPRGASIRIGDREHGKSDQLITLPETLIPEGATSVELTVKVFLDDRHTKNERVKITRGQIQRVEFRFDDTATPSADPYGENTKPKNRGVSNVVLPENLNPPLPMRLQEEEDPVVKNEGGQVGVSVVTGRQFTFPQKVEKVLADPDGGMLVLYSRHSDLRRISVYHLAHYTAKGVLDWKIENLRNNKKEKNFSACLRTPEGNYLFAGDEHDAWWQDFAIKDTQPFVILVSSQGKLIPWKKDPAKNRPGHAIGFVTPSPRGGFLLAGTKDGMASWFCRIDAEGRQLWEKTFPRMNQPSQILTCKDGGYFATGCFWDEKKSTLIQGNTWCCRFKEDGTLLWDTTIKIKKSLKFTQASDGFLALAPTGSMTGPNAIYPCNMVHVDPKGNQKIVSIKQPNHYQLDRNCLFYSPKMDVLTVACQEGAVNWEGFLRSGLMHVDPQTGKILGTSWFGGNFDIKSVSPLKDGKWFVLSDTNLFKFTRPDWYDARLTTIRVLKKKKRDTPTVSRDQPKPMERPVSQAIPPAEMKKEKITPAVDDKQGAGIAVVSQRSLSIPGAVRKVVADPDGGVLVLYSRYSLLQGTASYNLAHYDPAGKLDWRLEDIRSTSKSKEFKKPLRTARGDYLLYGEEHDFAKVANTAYEPFAIRVSANGKILPWKNELRKKLKGYRIHAATPTPEGGFLFAGTHYYATPPSEKQEIEHAVLWLCQVDAEGKKLWEKSYPQSSRPLSISVCPNGRYVIAGQLLTPAKIPLKKRTLAMFESGPTWLCYLDKSGELLWDTRLSDEAYRLLSKVLPTPRGFLTFNHKTIKRPSKRTTFATRLMHIGPSGKKRSFSLNLKGISLNTRQAILTPTEDVLVIATKRQEDKKDLKKASGLLRITTTGQTLKKGMSILEGLKSGATIEPLSDGKCLLVSSGEVDMKNALNQARKIVFTTIDMAPENADSTDSSRATHLDK